MSGQRPPSAPPEGQPPIDPMAWIRARLAMQTVRGEGGKWFARFQDKDLGEFPTQAAALKAYRKAAEERFKTAAILPTEEEIDKAGVVTLGFPRQAPAQREQPAATPSPRPSQRK